MPVAQEVNICEPGREPSMSEAVPEDMRLLHADLRDKKGMRCLLHCLGLLHDPHLPALTSALVNAPSACMVCLAGQHQLASTAEDCCCCLQGSP